MNHDLICPQCGEDHQGRCSAHSSRTGERCKKFAVKGANVCLTHGGSLPQVKRAAAARLAQAEALKAFPRRSPAEALVEAFHAADAKARKAADEGSPDAEQLAEKAATLAGQLVARLGADFEERLTRDDAGQIAAVLLEVLDRLELTPAQRARVPRAVRHALDRGGRGVGRVDQAALELLRTVEIRLVAPTLGLLRQAFDAALDAPDAPLTKAQREDAAARFAEELRALGETGTPFEVTGVVVEPRPDESDDGDQAVDEGGPEDDDAAARDATTGIELEGVTPVSMR